MDNIDLSQFSVAELNDAVTGGRGALTVLADVITMLVAHGDTINDRIGLIEVEIERKLELN